MPRRTTFSVTRTEQLSNAVKTITVSNETMILLRKYALNEIQGNIEQLNDGGWSIRINLETVARLDGLALPGEKYDDTLFRALSTKSGLN
jgi:hypothetical protein